MNKFVLTYQKMWKILTFFKYRNGVKILEKEWDNLIILDSCRYDTFKKVNKLKGKLSKAISRGSATSEWIKNNFKVPGKLNIDYISGVPYISNSYLEKKIGNNPFRKIIDVWNWGWDHNLEAVHPKTIVDATRKYYRRGQKTIIHFLQPHQPYINGGITEMSIKRIIEAYERNLVLVLDYVEELLSILKGKTIITSDHGECFGEYLILRHPEGVKIKALMEVPWFEVSGNE